MESVEEWIAIALKMPRNDNREERGEVLGDGLPRPKGLAMTTEKKGGSVGGWIVTLDGKEMIVEKKTSNGRRKVCGKWITMVNLGKGGGWFGKGNWLQWGKFCDIIGYVLS